MNVDKDSSFYDFINQQPSETGGLIDPSQNGRVDLTLDMSDVGNQFDLGLKQQQ